MIPDDVKAAVIAFFKRMIETWEGGFQAHPADVGNYVNGRLIGTNRGVTPAALALYRGIPVSTVTQEMMRSVTLDEAADIGYRNYYLAPGFDDLPWTEFTEAYVDAGWGSGPRTAIRHMQELIGAGRDGIIGPETQGKFDKYLEANGLADAMRAYVHQRIAFFEAIVRRRPSNQVFLKGWKRRGYAYLPENLGMPLDHHGYPEDLWKPGDPIINHAKSWEDIDDPMEGGDRLTSLVALVDDFARQYQGWQAAGG